MKSEYETIRLEVGDGLARLTLNRPERLNAMTRQMVRDTLDALTGVAADSSVRVLVLTGEGKGFCPGSDLVHAVSGAVEVPLEPKHFGVVTLLREMPAVTLAAVNGACAGAGMAWALACDLRVSAQSARFNTAFLDVGVPGDMGGPWTLSRVVGPAKARELFLLPGKFDAAEALRVGIVSRVFPDATFREDSESVIERLREAHPGALLTMKANFLAAERMTFGDYVEVESQRFLKFTGSGNHLEGFKAYLERRPSSFGQG